MSTFLRYIFGLLLLKPEKVENEFVFEVSYNVLNNLEILKFVPNLFNG